MTQVHRRAPGPSGLPLLGSLPAWKKDTAAFLQQVNREHGQVARVRLGPIDMHLVTDPTAVQRVLVDNNSNYVRGTLYEQFATVMGSGLLTTDGPRWRSHRRAVQPVFLRKAVDALAPNIVEATNDMLDNWETLSRNGESVDLLDETLRLTLDTLSRSLFNYDISPSVADLRHAVEGVIEIMFKRGTLSEMLPSVIPTKRRALVRDTRTRLHKMVEEVRARKYATGTSQLLELMDAAVDPETGQPWTAEEVRDEILTIYLAGHETTATALYWTLVSIAENPDIAAALDRELDQILGDRVPEFSDVAALDLTNRIVKESLRLYPPIWIFPRDAVDDDELGGYDISAGTSVLLSPLVAHRDERIWDNPNRFNPDRFLPAQHQQRHRMSYFPFGAGARMCIGNHLAELELALMVAMIRQRFDLDVDHSANTFGAPLISLRPLGDTRIKIRPRKSAANHHGFA